MPMVFEIHALPGKDGRRIALKFQRMGLSAVNARLAMVDIAWVMMSAISKNFESQGRRGGGSWKRLTPEWLDRKVSMGLDPRIGHATLALRHSLTVPRAAHQKLEIGNQFVRLGTDLPYAGTQQRHRPFLKFTAGDRIQMREAIRRHLMRAYGV